MTSTKKFGQISLYDAPRMLAVIASLPLVLSYKLSRRIGTKIRNTRRGSAFSAMLRRTFVKDDHAADSGCHRLVFRRVQRVHQARKLTPNIETLDNGLQIAWIGPKRTDRVALYLHGGGFTLFAPSSGLPFLHYVQEQVNKKGSPVGLAVLLYTLHPEATFPTPLREATAAVDHLINSGVAPKNLTLIGDSAGGNLILQLFSHILHRHPS
ncbi:Alpha/Beta hydrolase protein [Mucidula mucida]|nr:Alpha/Beta hydrolase protein [Mucidula mucida]